MGDSLGRFGDMTLWAKSYRMQRMPDRCQTDAKDRGWQLACGRDRIRGDFGPWGSVGNGEHPVSGQKITDLDSHVTSCRCVTPTYVCSECFERRGIYTKRWRWQRLFLSAWLLFIKAWQTRFFFQAIPSSFNVLPPTCNFPISRGSP